MSQNYTRSEWLELVKSWETSGQTQAAYCQDKGLKKATFGKWRSKFIASGEIQSFTSVKPSNDNDKPKTKSPSPGFIPFDVVSSHHSSSGDMIELMLPHGIIIRVPVDVSPSR
jgi:uncharacterized protein with NRDE domain